MIRRVLALAIVGSLSAVAGTCQASTGIIQVMIAGALASPVGTTADGQITLRLGTALPVSLVSGGAVVPGSLGTATFAQWSDTIPAADFGSPINLMVFRLTGGTMLVAGGITTPAGPLTTFSSTAPLERLSGTWTLASGAGVTGAGAGDAVVTFTFDTNPGNTATTFVDFVASKSVVLESSTWAASVPGIATVEVVRNVPVFTATLSSGPRTTIVVAPDASVGSRIGTLGSYSVRSIAGHPSEVFDLNAIHLGDGAFVLYGCVSTAGDLRTLACLVGGGGGPTSSISRLSGRIGPAVGPSSNAGLPPPFVLVNFGFGFDPVLSFSGSLP